MSDHLPECPHSEPDLNPGFLVMCICDRLRACEQRVEREWIEHCKRVEQRVRAGWYEIQSETWEQGIEYALDAAREAVERASSFMQPLGPALAAIDALRGSGNPHTPPSAEKGEQA